MTNSDTINVTNRVLYYNGITIGGAIWNNGGKHKMWPIIKKINIENNVDHNDTITLNCM